MSQPILTEHEVLQMDTLQMIQAHVDTLLGSDDVESVRTSAVALLNTEAGRIYIAANPVAI